MTLIEHTGFGASEPEAEEALTRACQRGEADAFEEIFRRHSSRLLVLARRRVSSLTEAEDAVQEVWVRAVRALPQFGQTGELRLGAWLTRILTNVCADQAAARASEQRKVDRLGVEREADDVELVDTVRDEGLRRRLVAALDKLPESQRQAFLLRAMGEMDYSEVAEATGITEANARARVHRARVALARRLSGVALGLSGVAGILSALRRRTGTRDTHISGGTGVAQGLISQAIAQPAVQAAMASPLPGGRSLFLAGVATVVTVTTGAAALTTVGGGANRQATTPPTAAAVPADLGQGSSGPTVSTPPETTAPSSVAMASAPSTSLAPRVSEMVLPPPPVTVPATRPDPTPIVAPSSPPVPAATTAPPPPPVAPTMTAPAWAAQAIGDAAAYTGGAAPAANSGCAGTPPATSTSSTPKDSSTASVTGDLYTGAVDQATVGPKVSIDPVALNMAVPGATGALPVSVSAEACLSAGSENLMVWFDFKDGSTAMGVGRVVGIDSGTDGNGSWFFSGPVESYVPGHTGVIAVTHDFVAEVQTAEPDNTASLAVAFVPNPPAAPSAKSGAEVTTKTTDDLSSGGAPSANATGGPQAGSPTSSTVTGGTVSSAPSNGGPTPAPSGSSSTPPTQANAPGSSAPSQSSPTSS